ncbi:hypothetical protein FJU30_04870 [Affinibrenneria salicis]|uniref:Uncharacterized protein n=1 Tax=Affinibrenneria salicis TaxID=2590031 RepID=A0A5J5G3E7_9GAMM|nr:hypothetical protein [Affinibrenneria salicis]KAA9001629.1 hypothetical protein FJU30_04870 [Affinibrenneria salicis]
MSRYNIKENIEIDPNGNIISETWEIFHEDGRLIKSGILSEKIAQEEVEALDTIDELEEASKHIKVSHKKSTLD